MAESCKTRLIPAPAPAPAARPRRFRYGVADRGSSIRIPLPVQLAGKGYLEDRRPAANVDPYTVARLLIKVAAWGEGRARGAYVSA